MRVEYSCLLNDNIDYITSIIFVCIIITVLIVFCPYRFVHRDLSHNNISVIESRTFQELNMLREL